MKNAFFALVCFFSIVSNLPAQGFDEFFSAGQRHRMTEKERLYQTASEYATTQAVEPSLFVAGTEKPLQLVESRFSVRIVGFLAEVNASYEFYNPYEEEVEGVFTFPLPEGATVDGYALDLPQYDEMFEGVAVPKQRATVVFDTIERRGIDPGLVQWDARQAFKCRVYPILDKNTRKIRIRYTTLLDESTFTLPVRLESEIKRCFITVEVQQHAEAPIIRFPDLPSGRKWKFEKKDDRFFVEEKLYAYHPRENFVLEFPQVTAKTQTVAGKSEDGTVHYALRQTMDELRTRVEPKRLEKENALQTPKKIALYWDASASRRSAALARELELLQRYLSTKRPEVELVVFRDTAEAPRTFKPEEYEKLLAVLKNVPYDGATNPKAFLSAAPVDAQLGLLFSDGIRTVFSVAQETPARHPIYCITSAAQVRETELALQNHVETVFNLRRDSLETILEGIGRLSLKAVLATPPKGETGDGPSLALKNALYVCGSGDEKPEVHVICGNERIETLTLAPDLSAVIEEEHRPLRLWAQLKLDELLVDPIRNREAILRHGLKFHLVTPETSLLVLESLDQYIEFKIEPPKSQSELYKKYHEKRTKYNFFETRVGKEYMRNGIRILQNDWAALRRWYAHEFKVPEDYRYVPQYHSLEEAFAKPSDRPVFYFSYDSQISGGGYGYSVGSGGNYAGSARGGSYFWGDDESDDVPATNTSPKVVLQPRKVDAFYVKDIRNAAKESLEKAYAVYLEEREQYSRSPVFYWDSAIVFQELGATYLSQRILGNLDEIGLHDDFATQNMIGYLMLQWNRFEEAQGRFRQVLASSENDRLALRGLALSFALRNNRNEEQTKELETAFRELLHKCWTRSDTRWYGSGIDYQYLLISLAEFARCGLELGEKKPEPFELDLRITALASHPISFGLAVVEPCGEEVRRGRTLSLHGGTLSETRESPRISQYMIRQAEKGKYRIVLERYDLPSEPEDWDWEGILDFERWIEEGWDEDEDDEFEDDEEPVTEKGIAFTPGVVFVDIFTNYGRANESKRSICITLDDETDSYDIAEVEL